ncbi:MAG: hypothetical protein ACRD3Q_17930 [Terriglobales bacterium]
MTGPAAPEAAEFLAVYYPLLKPVTDGAVGPSGFRGYLPYGFPQQFNEVVLDGPAVQIESFSTDPNGDPSDNQARLREQLDFFIADVERSLGSLRQKQRLVNTYAALPDGEGSQQLYSNLAWHYDRFRLSHQALLNFYRTLAAEFDQAGGHRSDLYAQLEEGQLPATAQAHLDSARTLRQDTMDPQESRPYYRSGPPYDSEIDRLEAALRQLEEPATYYAALSGGEQPAYTPLGADLRDLRLAFPATIPAF